MKRNENKVYLNTNDVGCNSSDKFQTYFLLNICLESFSSFFVNLWNFCLSSNLAAHVGRKLTTQPKLVKPSALYYIHLLILTSCHHYEHHKDAVSNNPDVFTQIYISLKKKEKRNSTQEN